MKVPESIADRLRALAVLEEPWKPVSRSALTAWVVFSVVVLAGAMGGGGLARWIDLVFVPIHEGGHLFSGWLGSHWLMVAGGTLLQLFVPFALAVYFAFRRQIPGTAFRAFFLFEQFLPIGTYMADARSQSLQYVTVGDPGKAEHDWYHPFSQAGVLDHDTAIGGFVRMLGWMGMLAVVGWLIWRAWPKRTDRKTKVLLPPPPPKIPPKFDFGDLGSNLDSAGKSAFWQWFHLEQTSEENGVHRFQPNGPKFHSLCYLDVPTSPSGAMQALTLGVQRKFIEGEDEPFARDLVKSFLSAIFPQRSEELGRLIEEVSSEFGGTRPVILAQSAQTDQRTVAVANPSAAYLVFIGHGKRCRLKSGAFEVVEENVSEGQTDWLCLRVRPSAW